LNGPTKQLMGLRYANPCFLIHLASESRKVSGY